MSVAELKRGVIAKERTGPGPGAAPMVSRTGSFRPSPTGSTRSTLGTARALAAYRVPEHAPIDDALVAAVAQSADMAVVIRNLKHFEPLGVLCIDPWQTRLRSHPDRDEHLLVDLPRRQGPCPMGS
jgi:hypothetical protein